MPLRLYMDESVSRPITVALQRHDVDLLSVHGEDRRGASDEAVLQRAIELDRVLFTQDDDFLVLAASYQSLGRSFPGIIYAHPAYTSVGPCIDDLILMAQAMDPEEMRDLIQYLPLK